MVYLAIGIAARSDEHLRLLQLLTRALGETDLAEALRRASSAEALLKLLQGAPQALALDAQLVGLNVPAEDFDELAWRGARLLQRADCVDSGFAAVLQQAEPLRWVRACGGCTASARFVSQAWPSSPRSSRCVTATSRSTVCSAWPALAPLTRPCSSGCAKC